MKGDQEASEITLRGDRETQLPGKGEEGEGS